MEHDAGVLVASDQESARGVHSTRGHGRAPAPRHLGHNIDTAPGPQVPEPHGLVLGTRDEHGPAPGVQREDVARVPRHGLEGGDSVTVSDIHLAVPGPC